LLVTGLVGGLILALAVLSLIRGNNRLQAWVYAHAGIFSIVFAFSILILLPVSGATGLIIGGTANLIVSFYIILGRAFSSQTAEPLDMNDISAGVSETGRVMVSGAHAVASGLKEGIAPNISEQRIREVSEVVAERAIIGTALIVSGLATGLIRGIKTVVTKSKEN